MCLGNNIIEPLAGREVVQLLPTIQEVVKVDGIKLKKFNLCGICDWLSVDKKWSPVSVWIGRPPRFCRRPSHLAIKTLEMWRAGF